MNKKSDIKPKIDVKNPRIPEKKNHIIDKDYVEQHKDYKPGVWMRDPNSLSSILIQQQIEKQNTERREPNYIKEEIDKFINEWNLEEKQNTQLIISKLENDIKARERVLESLRNQNSLETSPNNHEINLDDQRYEIENLYQKMNYEALEKQKTIEQKRKKLNEILKKKMEEQDRLLDLERKQVEAKNKNILEEEKMKNEIEKQKLEKLMKQREELLKQELNELSLIERYERNKKLIKEELKRSIKEREIEKKKLELLNNEIEALRVKEMQELERIGKIDQDIATRRRQLLKDTAYPLNSLKNSESLDLWPCHNDPNDVRPKCIIDTRDLCVDPYSGRLVIKGEINKRQDNTRTSENIQNASNNINKEKNKISKSNKNLLTKEKYLVLLSTYDPDKLKRKLTYQNWLINNKNLDEHTIMQKFAGSDFSLQIDEDDWPDIKNEALKRFDIINSKKSSYR